MADTVRTGLVGAGPWATVMHAPLLAGGPGTSLEAVWARREDAATELARQYGASVAGSFDELLERCDAIAFAVPPDVQAALAPRAAAAGKHLLLEKPLAFSLADAERLAAAVDEAGVRTLLFLTNRFTAEGREFVRRVAEAEPQAAQARSLGGGSLPGSFFATPWRVARGRPPRPRPARARPAGRRPRTGCRDHRHGRPDAGGGADHAARVRRPGPGPALDHHG